MVAAWLCCTAAFGQQVTGTSEKRFVTFSPGGSSAATVTVPAPVTAPAVPSAPDIDADIPSISGRQSQVFAIVIGNESYSIADEISVPYAVNDARVFREYLVRTLGVPAENIRLLTDATKGQMEGQIALVCNMAETYARKGEAEIIFYYAGHGLSDTEQRQSYLMPTDVIGSQVQLGVKLDDLYRKFGNLTNVKTTCFIDACFSGGTRSGEALVAARGIRVAPKESLISGNVVVFSAASGEQMAHPYREKRHGLFTYFLLKKIRETKGRATYGELSDYLTGEVPINALRINSSSQTPTIQCGYTAGDTWKEWTLR
jgi:hypothetical protein